MGVGITKSLMLNSPLLAGSWGISSILKDEALKASHSPLWAPDAGTQEFEMTQPILDISLVLLD